VKSKPLPILLALTLLFTQLPTVCAQQGPSNDWSVVQQLKTNSRLMVRQKNGKEIKGKMIEATDSALTIDKEGKPMSIARADIKQIYVTFGRAQKGKWSLIGAGAGAGAGAGIGALKWSPDRDDSEIWIAMGLLIGTGVGALSGLAFGQSRRDRELVYSVM